LTSKYYQKMVKKQFETLKMVDEKDQSERKEMKKCHSTMTFKPEINKRS